MQAAAGVTICVIEGAGGVHGPGEWAVLAGDGGVVANGKELTAGNTLLFAHFSHISIIDRLQSIAWLS